MKPFIIILLAFGLHRQCYGQTMNWKALPQELNDGAACLTVYDDKLIVGGTFTKAGDLPAKSIAAWDGTNWSNVGSSVAGKFAAVTEMVVDGNNLYIAGGFDSIGGIAAKNVAMWDGLQWHALGTGANDQIYALALYNNSVYVGGTFDSIGGIAANHIAKWDGTNWHPLGAGVHGNNINSLCVYQNELYVLGVFDSAGTIPANYIARWNDTIWNNLDSGLTYGYTSMIEWNNQLIVGAENFFSFPDQLVQQWNGNRWSQFSKQATPAANVFLIFNQQLFVGESFFSLGSPSSTSVHKWDSVDNLWNPIGTGINQTSSALCSYKGELYCSGYFNKHKGSPYNYLAKYTDVTGLDETGTNETTVTIYPMPAGQSFTIDIESTTAEYPLLFEVYNMLGEKVYSTSLLTKKTVIGDFESKGLFVWTIKECGQQVKMGKLFVQ